MFVDAKILLSNERTYIAWMHMAVVIGGVSAGLLSASASETHASELKGLVEPHGVSATMAMGQLLTPVAMIFSAFAAWMYSVRNRKIRANDFSDMVQERVPLLLGLILVCALSGILIVDLTEGGNIKLKY